MWTLTYRNHDAYTYIMWDVDRGGDRVIDNLVARLRNAILSSELSPGTKLNQSELAERYGVSRIPVRDALRLLAAQGFVEFTERSGASVTNLSVADLQELYELREAVEPLASRLAVPNVGRAQLLRMAECFRRMESLDDPEAWLTANADFHGQIYNQSARPRMVSLVESLRAQTDRYLRLHLEHLDQRNHLWEEHRLILEAAERRDAETLERVTRDHLATSHEFILKHLMEREFAASEGNG